MNQEVRVQVPLVTYEKKTITIERAAILLNEEIHTGRRHCNIIHGLAIKGFKIPIKGEQGFIDNNGNFWTRKEAAKIALNNGQIKELNWPPLLYTEDLY